MRKFLWLGLAVLAVVAVWSVAWLWLAGVINDQAKLLAAADGETQPRVTCERFAVTGYPFRFDAECLGATVVHGDLTVTLAGARVSVLAYNPTHAVFSAVAPLTYADAYTGSERRLDFASLEGSARVTSGNILRGLGGEGWRLARASVVANNVSWTDTVATEFLEYRADHLELHLTDVPEKHDPEAGRAALAAHVTASGADAPAWNVTDASATLTATLDRVPDDLANFGQPDALRSWQQAGGTLAFELAANQAQPEERLEIRGDASLNAAGQVNAVINFTTKGVLGRLSPVLSAIQIAALRGIPGQDGSFSNRVNIVDGRLRLLAIPLFEIPPLF